MPASLSASSVATSAHIVNGSSFRRSGAGKYFSGSQSTQAANLTACSLVSKRVIGATEFSPRSMRENEVSTSNPRGLMVPRPVTTTRRMWIHGSHEASQARGSGLARAVVDRVADGSDLRRVLVGERDLESVLELHYELVDDERVSSGVVSERSLALVRLGRLAKVVADDLDHALFDRRLGHESVLQRGMACTRFGGFGIGRFGESGIRQSGGFGIRRFG